ncbi:MBL fold metallo-hydrolase [Baaleninema sp.]|uniref:MBL fold metallo-hydrolase n=1 Tax=Baaleninema sp. TaxID=3101197 RepID=UPI003D0083DB
MPKQPRAVFENLFAFPPNRDTLGGTAYFIVENDGNILIDAPPWNEETQAFLRDCGGVRSIFLTHRDSIGKAQQIQKDTGCAIVVHEREAYLLPEAEVTTFSEELEITSDLLGIWTPGHTPGSSCVYLSRHGGVLFSGRHLLPNPAGQPRPLRTAKTFHWPRQLRSVAKLRDRFSPETLSWICPGASLGFLRGKRAIDNAYTQLAKIDLEASLQEKVLM